MNTWRTLLHWMRRAGVTRRALIRSLAASVISQLASHALTIGAPLLLVMAWSQHGWGNPLQRIAIPLVIIEIVAFLRSPLRYMDRMNAHRLGVSAVSTWRQWLTEQVSRWSFRTMSATSRADLLSQSVLDIESLQQIWLRVAIPLCSTLVSYVITLTASVALIIAYLGLNSMVWLVIGVAGLTCAVLAALSWQLPRIVSSLRALQTSRTNAAVDLYGLQQLSSELTLLRARSDEVVTLEHSALGEWRRLQLADERWWHRIDVSLVAMAAACVIFSATTTTYLTLSGPWDVRVVNAGVVGVLFASLTGELFATWRVGLESAASIVITGDGLTAREVPVASNSVGLPWPENPTEFVLPGALTFTRGQMVAIVGPSGSGKSTWLRGVAQLDALPTKLLVNGVATGEMREDALRSHVVHVATEPRFLGTRLPDELALGRTDLGDVGSLLQTLGLSSNPSVRPAQCSRGERHRYAIARAVSRQPDLLLLDEPTAGLGPRERDAVLAALRTSTMTVLLVTHDPAVIAACDHVVSMESLRD